MTFQWDAEEYAKNSTAQLGGYDSKGPLRSNEQGDISVRMVRLEIEAESA